VVVNAVVKLATQEQSRRCLTLRVAACRSRFASRRDNRSIIAPSRLSHPDPIDDERGAHDIRIAFLPLPKRRNR